MGERNTEQLLREWGKWVREGGGVDLGMHCALTSLLPAKPRGYIASIISDSDALEIDRIIATLRISRLVMARVLWLEFACGYSTRKIAAIMNCSREQASNMSGRAVGLVDCAINPGIFTQDDLEQMAKLLQAA